jgi:hypothetical protein
MVCDASVMSDESRPLTLGDMVVGLVAELQERVELTGEARRVVLLTVALAANNGRLLGLDEALTRAREQGVDLDLGLSRAEKEAPATLAQTLGGT